MHKPKSGGRPSKERAARIEEEILIAAEVLFLEYGFGSTSIEKVAAACRISKRTFYDRFENKEALFAGVVHRLIARLKPADMERLFEGTSLKAILLKLGDAMLHAALTPQALALHRLLLAEGSRFPQLAAVMSAEGTKNQAVLHIAELLRRETHTYRIDVEDAEFAAGQFMQMVISTPRQRAMSANAPMTEPELSRWAEKSVQLFLNGCGPANGTS